MKFLYAALLLATLIIWGVYFFNKGNKKENRAIQFTEVTISNKIINTGNSPLNKEIGGVFEIVNTGSNPLIIQNVTTDCNCTVPEWEKKPILPLNKTYIKLIYNAHASGYYQKKATVTCNISNSPIILVLRGNISN